MKSPPIRDRTVLVTGGAGFIGSHIVDALVPENDVRVLDDFSSGHRRNLPEGVQIIDGDIADPIALQKAARGVDLIFHEAALVSVTRSVDEPRTSNQTNLESTVLVLEQARQEDARVVLASSAAIYGHPDELPVTERAAPDPTSPYGIQKLAIDQYARLYDELYDLPTVVLRYFNVYGPRQQGPYSGVISTFLEQARNGEPLTIDGDGEQTRDFVHVNDVVRANLRAATTDRTGEAYNIGTGQSSTILELARTVRKATDSESSIVHEPPRAGDVRHSQADISKARQQLEFEPRVSLEAGIRSIGTDPANESSVSDADELPSLNSS